VEKTLVFIHGAGEGSWIWKEQIKFFKNSIALNLPGHFGEENVEINSIEDYALWTIKKIEEKKLKNVILVGHSMGGAIAIVIALKKPIWLNSIILIATGAKLKVLPAILESLKVSYNDALEILTKKSFKINPDLKIILEYRKNFLEVPLNIILRDFICCNKFDYMDKIEDIEVKTLIICGEEDLLTPVKYSKYLNQKIKNSELHIIKDAGHMVMLEKPNEVNEIIRKFIENDP